MKMLILMFSIILSIIICIIGAKIDANNEGDEGSTNLKGAILTGTGFITLLIIMIYLVFNWQSLLTDFVHLFPAFNN